MDIKLNSKIILLTVAVTLISISSVYAQPPFMRDSEERKARREACKKELSEKLNLSQEQQKLLDAHEKEHRQKMRELFSSIRNKRLELHEELQNPVLDLEKIKLKQGELKALFSSMLDLRLEGILKVNEILTPEQRKIMSEYSKGKRRHFPPFDEMKEMDILPPPHGDKEGRCVPPQPFDSMRGMCVPPPPSGAMKGMDVPHPPPFAMRGMCVTPLPFDALEGMDDIMN